MIRSLFALALSATVLTASGAWAQSPVSNPTAPTPTAPTTPPTLVAPVTVQGAQRDRTDTPDQIMRGRGYDPNQRVCRAITATGSRLGARRLCRTRGEWDAAASRDRDATDAITRQTRVPGG